MTPDLLSEIYGTQASSFFEQAFGDQPNSLIYVAAHVVNASAKASLNQIIADAVPLRSSLLGLEYRGTNGWGSTPPSNPPVTSNPGGVMTVPACYQAHVPASGLPTIPASAGQYITSQNVGGVVIQDVKVGWSGYVQVPHTMTKVGGGKVTTYSNGAPLPGAVWISNLDACVQFLRWLQAVPAAASVTSEIHGYEMQVETFRSRVVALKTAIGA